VVITVGRIENFPNAVNVVPERVEFTIDFRAGNSGVLDEQHPRIVETIEAICRGRNVTCEISRTEQIPVRPMDARLVDALARAAGNVPITVSGALHDAAILAPIVPTVMLFVPSRDGISHNPAEFSRVEDIAHACGVIEKLVRRPTPARLSAMSREQFVAAVGGVFEHSAWIAERAFAKGPFGTIEELHRAMCAVVAESSADEQLALIRAHPDLVGRLAREGRLTRESTAEQAAAGLDVLSAEEIERFETYNAAYREKFGFPFVICARENRKESILAAFPVRLGNDREQEIRAALAEIYKIALLRLNDALWE
jgi:2-oxo-4-hydroxy-4-carboxy-5-ureidoimidazoline decarboxylase